MEYKGFTLKCNNCGNDVILTQDKDDFKEDIIKQSNDVVNLLGKYDGINEIKCENCGQCIGGR